MGGRLGVWKGVLWVWFNERHVSGVFGCNFSVAGEQALTRGIRWTFPGKILNGPRQGDLEGVLVENSRWTLAGRFGRLFGWKFQMDSGWVIWKDFWLEYVMMRCSGDQMKFRLGGQQKDVALSTTQVRGPVMCGLGVLVGLVYVRVLRGVGTNGVGSCERRHLY